MMEMAVKSEIREKTEREDLGGRMSAGGGKTRIEWMDAVKGVAIVLMIFGHSMAEGQTLRTIVYSFHMPLFILISGYFSRQETFVKVMQKSVKGILLPYAAALYIKYLLLILLDKVPWGIAHSRYLATLLVSGGFFWGSPIEQADNPDVLWFLPMLFCVRMIFWCILKISRGNVRTQVCLVLLSVITGAYLPQIKIMLAWSLDVSLFCVGFYFFGYLLRQKNLLTEMISDKWCMSCCALLWAAGVWRGLSLELLWRYYPGELSCVVVATAGIMVCCMATSYVCRMKVLQRTLAWIGRGSLVILGIHLLEREFFPYGDTPPGYRLFLYKMIVILCGYLICCLGKRAVTTAARYCSQVNL